jgi:cytochrome c oxidase assembly factor CtaG
MIARIVLDLVQEPEPTRPIALILIGALIVMMLLEGGILAAFGLRPIGKAFTNSFLVNMAACGSGFVFWMACEILEMPVTASIIAVWLAATAVQGLVLSTQRDNLSLGRSWLAAVAMKSVSAGLLIAGFLLFSN